MQHLPSCHPQSARIDSNTPITESDDATLTDMHGTTREPIPSNAQRAQEGGRVTNSGRIERLPRTQQRTTANERGGRRISVKNYTSEEVEELLNGIAATQRISANTQATSRVWNNSLTLDFLQRHRKLRNQAKLKTAATGIVYVLLPILLLLLVRRRKKHQRSSVQYLRAALFNPTLGNFSTPWKRLLTYGKDSDFIVSINFTKDLLITRLLPYFSEVRRSVNYGGPYRFSSTL